MKKQLLSIIGICTALISCQSNNQENSSIKREKELLQKELELTKKELVLKEKENALLADKNHQIERVDSRTSFQGDPRLIVQEIFEGAKSGDFSRFSSLCDPKGEGDKETERICAIDLLPDEAKEQFMLYFKAGEIVGEPIIVGDEAKVNFSFGPDGSQRETMELVKRGNKWYLSSF
jgi:hypothetical protein